MNHPIRRKRVLRDYIRANPKPFSWKEVRKAAIEFIESLLLAAFIIGVLALTIYGAATGH